VEVFDPPCSISREMNAEFQKGFFFVLIDSDEAPEITKISDGETESLVPPLPNLDRPT